MLLPIFSLFCFSPLCRCRSYPSSSVPFRSDSERVKVLPGGEREERGERREERGADEKEALAAAAAAAVVKTRQ